MSQTMKSPPPHHVSPKGMWNSKLALRFIQFTLATSLVGCVGSAYSVGFWDGIATVVILPQVAVSYPRHTGDPIHRSVDV
ncbi:hypothetical protein VTG60DRAFT_2951 [Thermothelomyces hinnuleus]